MVQKMLLLKEEELFFKEKIMKKSLSILTLLCLILVMSAGNSFATYYDYSDATGYSSAVAYAQNGSWNRLGTGWTSELGPIANNGDADDGVLWSVNGGAYGNGAINKGDDVTFKFTVYKELWGQHNTDWLKVWIDWNNDKDFTDAGENIYGSSWVFTPQKDNTPASIAKAYKYFYFTINDINVAAGDYWLRARTVCNADVSLLNNVSSTGYYYQGEIEDWKLTVNNQVPEPASLLLFGLGLLGIAGLRRKFKK